MPAALHNYLRTMQEVSSVTENVWVPCKVRFCAPKLNFTKGGGQALGPSRCKACGGVRYATAGGDLLLNMTTNFTHPDYVKASKVVQLPIRDLDNIVVTSLV
ncbi:hypothetical protein TNCV_1696661 [Trichonephila clavipes]|nr:hypothetical protein TNCV_1696661 [Trichonephila clavipes]